MAIIALAAFELDLNLILYSEDNKMKMYLFERGLKIVENNCGVRFIAST